MPTDSPLTASDPPAAATAADPGQEAVVAFLADPATHGAPVETIATHGARLFLAGDRAFKLKRAIRYPYMDFSTRAKRAAACRAEVAVNRRTAPALYLAARPILRGADGLRLGAAGEEDEPGAAVLDTVVEMRRFDQQDLFDRMAERGTLTEAHVVGLAEAAAALHRTAEPPPPGWSDRMEWIVADNLEGLRTLAAAPPALLDTIEAASRSALDRTAALRAERLTQGRVRRCHGDLHLRNVCLFEGRPTPFDAIEFNDDIAICDVLYDLAFLLMDLDHRGLRPFACRVLNRWLERMEGEEAALSLLPLFLSQRALVRAKVTATAAPAATAAAAEAMRAEAGAYVALAAHYLAPPPPRLIALGGWSGTGKTTLARHIAPSIGPAPGAVVIRSDVERKRLAGVAETERLPPDSYTQAASDAVYAAMRQRAAIVLAAGHAAIADAVHSTEAERRAIAEVTEAAGVRFDGVWLEAPLALSQQRVEARRGDASDADAAVVEAQHRMGITGAPSWPALSTEGPPETVAARLAGRLAVAAEAGRSGG